LAGRASPAAESGGPGSAARGGRGLGALKPALSPPYVGFLVDEGCGL
jgi:hypothetical protein